MRALGVAVSLIVVRTLPIGCNLLRKQAAQSLPALAKHEPDDVPVSEYQNKASREHDERGDNESPTVLLRAVVKADRNLAKLPSDRENERSEC